VRNNYFLSLVTPRSGSLIKVFSAGQLAKGETTRIKRSVETFRKTFIQLIKYLKNKRITQLRFIQVFQHKYKTTTSLVARNIVKIRKTLNNAKIIVDR